MTGFRTLDRFRGQSQPKISVSVSLQKPTYPNQFSMRNTNLESKIARHQLFDLKVTLWPDMSKCRVKINVTFSLHKPTYRGLFSWGIRIWNWKWQGINYLTSKWPFDLTCLNAGSKLMLLFHYKNQPIRASFSWRIWIWNRKQQGINYLTGKWPFDLTYLHQVRSIGTRSKLMFSFCYKTSLPGPVFSWGVRIWNRKQHGIYYLTLKWPFDLIYLTVRSRPILN